MENMENKEIRTQLLEEYYRLSAIIQNYDPYFVSIKTWGVTVSGLAIGVGFSKGSSEVFVVAFALSIGFWLTEVCFKLLQLGHSGRIEELERELQRNNNIASPEIYQAFVKRRKEDMKRIYWLRVMFWPHVMFPHLIFVCLSLYFLLRTKT